MTTTKRQAAIVGAAIALGIAGAWLAFGSKPAPEAAGAATGPGANVAAPPPTTPGSAAPTASAPAAGPCPAQVTTALSDAKDGQFQLQADVAGKTEKESAAFIVVGKEAAASGRARDAEVAFMMSCRVAEQTKGGNSLPAADAKYQLARHYANLALHGGGGTNRAELLRRAERLYADSLEIYRASHGPAHEKTRFAAEGLGALRPPAAEPGRPVTAQSPARPAQPKASGPQSAAAPAQAQAPAPQAPTSRVQPPTAPPVAARAQPAAPAPASARNSPEAPAPATARVQNPTPPPVATARVQVAPAARSPETPARNRTATGASTTAAPAQAQGSAGVLDSPQTQRPAVAQGSATALAGAGEPIRPSFNCANARSRAERIICSDPELARQDRELGRLYARARDAAPDSAAFRRQSEQEWRRREATCEDRECLLRWYAQRRSQLNADIAESR